MHIVESTKTTNITLLIEFKVSEADILQLTLDDLYDDNWCFQGYPVEISDDTFTCCVKVTMQG
jgi:hypothetical protein